ncbi:MAG TPA: hypothetical protein VGQ44_05280 [Gemmatimonadaceae bacterium]|nr:hypothetical protein [Gemmatimonadaceae bacterium]
MNQPDDPHTPTPEFRESLKRELKRAYRAELQFGVRPSRSAPIGKVVAVIGIAAGAVFALTTGLVLGMNTGPAAAEALATNQREVAATSLATTRAFTSSRLALARVVYDSIRRAYAAGQATKADLDKAKSEVDTMEANAAQVEVDARSAPAPKPRTCRSILKEAPVKNALAALVCGAVASAQTPASRQQGIPVLSLTAPVARTTSTFGAILGVRELSDGRVLVNDAGRRQLKIFDASLANATIAFDSTPGASNSYGTRADQIVPYLGDSTIFNQGYGEPKLMLDGTGRAVHAIALPDYSDGATPFPVPFAAPQASDPKGRLYARGGTMVRGVNGVGVTADSVLILRADLEARTVDVAGALHIAVGKNRGDPPENGNRVVTTIIQPVPTEDSWAVLSDGTLAFVRGRDYHVDWVLPDGGMKSTDKLPFDWKRLTDDEKQKLADSAKVVWDSLMAIRNRRVNTPVNPGRPDGGGGDGANQGRGRSSGGVDPTGQAGSIQRMISVPLSEIPDYFPPIHRNAALADLDGNLWVLTTTTAQSLHGELVYDVLSPARGLYERVRMPVGRSIAGFGKGGVVYLQSGDRAAGFTLERVKLETSKPSK